MLDVFDVDGHVRQALALYVMDALSEDLCAEIDSHIDRCEVCRIELRELHKITLALALVSAEEAEELIGEAAVTDSSWRGRSLTTVGPQPPRTAEPRDRSAPPRLRPATARPGRWRRRRQLILWHARAAVAAAVFAMIIGFSVGMLLKAFNSGAPIATAAAQADDQNTGVSLSASASGHGNGVSIHATVDGLEPRKAYHLFVVTGDGVAHLVQQWSSPDGAQVIDQEIAVPIGLLAYFTVVEADGRVVMLAWCRRGPAPAG